MNEPIKQKFFYWTWSFFHVIVFILLSMLCMAPAFFVVAAVAYGIDALIEPGPYKPGVDWVGVGAIAILSMPLAMLLAQAIFWMSTRISTHIHIKGEKEYGPAITAAIAGLLTVLVWTGKIQLDRHAHYDIWLSASAFAGFALLLLNFVAWILRLITGREIIFAHLQRLQAEQQAALEQKRKARAKRRKAKAKAQD